MIIIKSNVNLYCFGRKTDIIRIALIIGLISVLDSNRKFVKVTRIKDFIKG